MKIYRLLKIFALVSILALSASSCLNELDTEPKYDYTLEELIKKDPNAVNGLLSRMYASYALSSVTGPDKSDIEGASAGESPFVRGLVNLQDFTADQMKNKWGDNGLDQLTTSSNWTASNKFFKYVYDRLYYIIPQTTNLILILQNNNISYANKEQVVGELRFLRAMAYYYIVDLFGKGVLVTNDTYNKAEPLPEATRLELFKYAENELLAAESTLPDTNSYGRATKSAAWMLLAKLYMNAQVYTGTARYNDAAVYINKIIASGKYRLEPNYKLNFSTDNNNSKEIIFPLIADAVNSQSYGNTTYIIQGNVSVDTMTPSNYGVVGPTAGSWAGHRATKAWYGLFGFSAADLTNSNDVRAKLFWTTGHNWEMNDYKEWKDGYPSIKFTNNSTTGLGTPSVFVSTDFPLFRYSDVLLMYAECALRGATGTTISEGLKYVNDVRKRAGVTSDLVSINLQNVLDERGRELGLEGVRRQDLIRFGKFTGSSYLWPWKGGVKEGTAIPNTYNVFPIPLSALQANPNLTQNPGY